ncbi:MAG: ribosomal protein S18-alanine N-acetyltransferase [Endomicrobiia bacterium]
MVSDLNIVITEAKEKDLEQIYQIEKENFSYFWSKDFILFNIKLPKNLKKFFVAKIDENVVGYVVCLTSDKTSHIINISVKKDFQNLGIGNKLLDFIIKSFKTENFKSIILEVRASNLVAISLYKKFGFKEVRIKKKFYPDGEDAIFMIKHL